MTETEMKLLSQAGNVTAADALRDLRSIFYNQSGLYTDDSFAFVMAFDALERQIASTEMDISYTNELPNHITLKIDYSDLLNEDESKFIDGLCRCIIQLYRQAKERGGGK